jgi:hypothetical protein
MILNRSWRFDATDTGNGKLLIGSQNQSRAGGLPNAVRITGERMRFGGGGIDPLNLATYRVVWSRTSH